MDPREPQAFANAIQDNTRLVFGETLGNPSLDVLNIPAIAEVAHAAGLPLMVDSTTTTPYLIKPFELGADIIQHSATKFLSGTVSSLAACSWTAASLTGKPQGNSQHCQSLTKGS